MQPEDDVNGRTCIVTRKSGTSDDLIRFVAGPDGRVVADLKRRLPGRGCWVTAERPVVEEAVKRKLFRRALRAEIVVPDGLPAEIDRLMVLDLVGMMGLARKAGQFVCGATKVDHAVRDGSALAVFHAADAAADGMRKIDQARHARARAAAADEIPAFRLVDAGQMNTGLGDGGLIHCAALAGQAGEGVVKRAIRLDRYRHGLRTTPRDE